MDLDSYLKEPLPFELDIDKYLDPNSAITIFEIGACEGEDTIKLRKKFPNSAIYSFEPLSKNISRFKAHLLEYGISPVPIFDLALSNKRGNAQFHVSSGQPDHRKPTEDWDYGNKSSSLLAPKEHKKTHSWIKFDEKIQVKTERLDLFCKERGIKQIDFIYMDVQGAELMVLEGAGQYLKGVGAIWMEVEAIELYAKQPLKDSVEKFMKKNGFHCVKDTVNHVSGDQLYINNRLIKSTRRARAVKLLKSKVPRPVKAALRKSARDQGFVNLGEGQKMNIPDDMAWAFNNGAYYEHNVLFWLQKLAYSSDKPVFYDVGSNYGYYALKISKFANTVYAFEPVESTFVTLQKNIIINNLRNVKTVKIALGVTKEIKEINIYSSSGNNSVYNRNIPKDHSLKLLGKETINVNTMDNFVEQSDVKPPTIIKIDVEGAEMDVLKGAVNIIKKYKPSVVIEYSKTTSDDAGYKREEILKTLKKSGYKIYGLSNDPDDMKLYDPASKEVIVDNLVAINPSSNIKLV